MSDRWEGVRIQYREMKKRSHSCTLGGHGRIRTYDQAVIDAIPAGLHFYILLIEILTADLTDIQNNPNLYTRSYVFDFKD